ncbi:Uncharacterized protein TPAR_08440 [Tolypocladium paradoxum]|uniref:MFS transporter n=1 Tax=Tolypocladium paradoxum TaxID=94208 RepID=A0A2S4KMB9_9HYPO|nr:Uncharacterized protein TPAR_08440 [Tolypocladium paradoxum]
MASTGRPSEATRLLDPASPPNPPSPTSSRAKGPSPWKAILSAAAVYLLLSIGSHISLAPQTAILEDIICRQYYAGHVDSGSATPANDGCKIDAVQSEVASINGWRDVFETLPAMLLAVPYGTLADRAGRKTVLLLSIVGYFMTDVWIRLVYWFPGFFPVRAVWFAGLWQVIGGGTLSSVAFVMVADWLTPVIRTTAFSQIQSASLVSQFIFVPVGAVLMPLSPWIPMFLSSGIMIAGFLFAVVFVPETLPSAGADSNIRHDDAAADASKGSAFSRIQEHLGRFSELGRWMARNAKVVLALSCFYPLNLGEQCGGPLLLQYTSKRLGWSLGQASYLLSLRAGVNLVVLAVLIPAISSILLRRLQVQEIVKDQFLAQASSLLLALGSGTIFLARSWPPLLCGQLLFSLGFAFAVPARSLVTSMVEQKHLGAVYTTIAVLTYAGVLTGRPLLARAFQWGLELGEAWMGMPFLIASGCFVLALLAVTSAATRNGGQGHEYENVANEVHDESHERGGQTSR